MTFRTWRNRRRLARIVHSSPIYATVAEDMKLDPHVAVHNLFKEHPQWPA